MNIGERIKEIRKVRKMTQKQLAEAAEVAVGTIQQYELGKRQPRLEQLRKIALALDATVSDFVGGDYWASLSEPEQKTAFSSNPNKELLNMLFDQLNDEGQTKAVERVEELTEIPKYQKKPEAD